MKSAIEKERKLTRLSKKSLIILAGCMLFYVGMALFYGPVQASDSKGYIEMISAREPVYPVFLLILRSICGGNQIYLNLAVIIQSLLMGTAVWKLTETLDKLFSLNIWQIVLILLSNVGVAMVCILFTARGVPYTNIILTEGLALPLWIFFIDLLINGIYKEKMMNIFAALILCAVMMDIRKQMAIGFIVTVVSVALCSIKKSSFIKKLVITMGCCVAAVTLAIAGTRLYNLMLRGEFVQNTRDMNLVLTTSLYVSDREDAELIKDEAVKELFLKVWDELEKEECAYSFAPKGLAGLQKHYSDSFDKITINTTADLFVQDAVSRGYQEGLEAEKEADRASSVIVKSLIKDNIGKYFMVYISSLSEGFINSVAKRNKVLDIYALIMYLTYISLMIYNFKKKDCLIKAQFGLIVAIAIAVNVGVTGALIFCQTRYMIYNMALFYTGLIVMFPFKMTK